MPLRLAALALGTRVELVLGGQQAERDLRATGEAALAEIEAAERRLSRYIPEGLPARLARAGGAFVAVDADDWELLEECQRAAEHSAGAFDATLGSGRLELDRARRRAALERGAGVDFGGIAQGHALDLAARTLRQAGVGCALLQAGTSSVAALGAPPGLGGWRVQLGGAPGVPGTGAPSTGAAYVELRDQALSVSRADLRAHVVDPRLRTAARRAGLAAAVHPLGSRAEAWSTAALVLAELPADLDGCGVLVDARAHGALARAFHFGSPERVRRECA